MPGLSARFANRRALLKGAALAGATALGAAACGPGKKAAASPTPTAPVDLGSPGAVPVGGARLYRDDKVVVYCPAKGSYKGFSAVCTHQGCVLTEIVGTTGECPCHGSRFDVTTGKVVQGPAQAPLPPVPVRAEGGRLVAGPDAAAGKASTGASAGA
ncbi:Rieske 2Fe-2S domain-containing protein [Streptomyces sp. DW26H14]|uniref:Rieske 2Fe-2S domain-containing protein n=1 Tax=Streptomyces sp. DW26H14 TaxID=3435395 RepID=UPI00403DC167